MLVQILFGYFAFVIVFSSFMGITRKNIFHSLLWILLMFLHMGGIYLLLNAEFIAMVQIIVYAGAILVMFLFVLFLFNFKEEINEKIFLSSWQARLYTVLIILFIFILGLLSYEQKYKGPYTIDLIEKQGHTKTIGIALFNEYLLLLLVLGFMLLIPLIGVGLVHRRRQKNGNS